MTAALTHNGFEVREEPDGSHTLLDVPIFFECERDGENYDAAYLATVFDKFRSWERDGHLPPMTVGHRRRDRQEPTGAGFFRATRLGSFRGRKAIFADLTYTNPAVWDDVVRKRLPYRSAEATLPKDGDPEIESLALLANAPFLQMPMTFPATAGDVTRVTPETVTVSPARASFAPVVAFAAFADRCLVVMEDPVAEPAVAEPAAPAKRRVRVSGATGQVVPFAEDPPPTKKKDGEDDGGAPKGGDQPPAAPPKTGEPPKAGAGGMSEAVQKIKELAQTPVPLEDVPAVLRLLEEKVAALKGAMSGGKSGSDDDDEQDDEPEEPNGDHPPAPSEDLAEPDAETTPPPKRKEPMNMSATPPAAAPTTPPAAPVGEVLGRVAAIESRTAAIEDREKKQLAKFAAMKELSNYHLGGEGNEAVIAKVIEESGESWERELARFSATVKQFGTPSRAQLTSGAPATDNGEWPEAVRKVAKTPEEGERAIRLFQVFTDNQKRGLNVRDSFETFYAANRDHVATRAR